VFIPGLTLLATGVAMVPFGIAVPVPPGVRIATIVAGTVVLTLGAMLGLLPIRWTELKIGFLTGVIRAEEADFRHFYRAHRERLYRFATMMCGGDQEQATKLLLEASARTQLNWGSGAAAEPLTATLRALLSGLEHPGLWELFVAGRKLRRWDRSHAPITVRRETIEALGTLPFRTRAALLLDGLFGLAPEEIARLLGSPVAEIRTQVEAAVVQIGLGAGREASDAHR
jgi:DNA-directed RNA polymerase specialized sigma24 family protein